MHTDIHGITNRIIPAGAIVWAREKILPRVKANDARDGTRWHGRFVDALLMMEKEPVRCEKHHDGSYTAAFRSSTDPRVEYYTTETTCTCPGCGGHMVKTKDGGKEFVAGYCWHKAAIALLKQIDRWEKNEMRKAFRVVYTNNHFILKYRGEAVAEVTFDVFDDAVEHIAHCIEQAFAA